MPEAASKAPAVPAADAAASAVTPTPTLAGLRQVSDGWIKKYVLTYTMPDGSAYEYESASRKGP